jgi:apolipoprotein N-acyltransferase
MRMDNFLQHLILKKLFLAIISGLLLSLSYNVSALWFLSFFALIPLLLLLKRVQSLKARFFWSFFVGVLYYGSVFLFLFSGHPITWAGIASPALSLVFIVCAWILTVALFSLFTGVWGVVSHNLSGGAGIIPIASLWVILEWVQALSLSLFWWGGSGLVGSHWTLGFVGYTLAEFPLLLSLASLGGVHLLSFVVVFINVLIFRFVVIHRTNRRTLLELSFSIILTLLISSALFTVNARARDNAKTARIASIYTTFEPQFFTTPESETLKNTQIAGLFDAILFEGKNPHLILLPENSRYLEGLSTEKRKNLVHRMSAEENVAIVDSRYLYDKTKGSNVAILEFETGDDEIESYEKQLLVPTAEYLPHIINVLGNLFLEKDWNEHFEEHLSISNGDKTTIGEHEELRIGALFCSEVLTPSLYRESTRLGANILVNTASHSVLNNSEHLYNQIIKFSKTRAVENNRFFVQSGNSVPSFFIDNHGRMLGETERDKNSILYADVLLLENKTVATTTGDIWVFLFLLLVGGVLVKKTPQDTHMHT